ncbi:permease [Actibacterium mucosum KCTC 23349]|uniref:Permease n=1 Tax=Actibacterium mucosum KCTC 23349 TaxID=1454373 RepID=A0A037ZJ05_9RHOB|nr:LPS export ABC transporter permease LptF [Actibacterium mucosum]KAJ55619.1 permease [Actibacterium mucosum KCTC 23349]
MPRFDRYILSQLVVLFGFFSLVLVSVYWVNRAVGLFDQLIGDGQSALVFLQFTALSLPNVVRLVLPVSGFAATVYAINRLTSDSELVVAQAMGLSPFRLARPVLVFGLLVAALVSVLNHVLVPASRAELRERSAEISEDIAAQILVEGQFIHPSKGITIFIGEITPLGELNDLLLVDETVPGQDITYTAERALLVSAEDGPKLVMFNGMAQVLRVGSNTMSTTRFQDAVYDVAGMIAVRSDQRVDMQGLPTMTLLQADPVIVALAGETRASFLYEGHARISQPFLAVAAALIGLGALLLGGFSRFGLWRQILFAFVLLIILQALDNSSGQLARSDENLWIAVYFPPVAGIAVACIMFWIAGRPDFGKRAKRPLPEATA